MVATLDSNLMLQVLCVALGVAACAVYVARGSRSRMDWAIAATLPIAASVGGFFYAGALAKDATSAQGITAALPDRPGPDQAADDLHAGYVSSNRCAACHPGQYASWHQSYHRTMTQPATPASVQGPFDGRVLEAKGRRYRVARRDDEFWVEMADPDWEASLLGRGMRPEQVSGEFVPIRWKRVVMTTGSHHMQTYWVASERDGRLFNFPWLWLNEDQRWIPREDGFIRPPRGGRTFDVWHDSCIECHAVAGEKGFDPATGWDPEVAELGIACEACHGPAEEHIRRHENPLRRLTARWDETPDPTIVNPARLDANASSQVCGACHGINMWKPGPLAEGIRYRPGADLRDTRVILRASQKAGTSKDPVEQRDWRTLQNQLEEVKKTNPTVLEERFWSDGMVRVSGREHNGMIESACFDGGELSCLSCHSMHDSNPVDQIAKNRIDDAACVGCHPAIAANPSAHTNHATESGGSRCQNCHMPHTVYGLLKNIRSHQIDSPSVTSTLETGRANACNLCHLDRSLGWAADQLNAWYDQPRPELSSDQEQIGEGIRQALTGNAQQRAMMAWHMGWPEAKQAAGDDWMAFFLGHLLDDPYPAVRYIAGHSLSKLGADVGREADFLAAPNDRANQRVRAMAKGRVLAETSGAAGLDDAERLLMRAGQIDPVWFQQLAAQRDDEPLDLRE